jgi:hypothetical protein
MKKLFLIAAMLLLANYMFATIILIDQNGAGQYSTIQAGINASNAGDTVRVWPGTYQEQITLNKNILLEGSGYENCIITSTSNPTIILSSGKIRWFFISSLGGVGIKISGTGAIVSNCVIQGCAGVGILSNTNGSNSVVINCNSIDNGNIGIQAVNGGCINVINCISWSNSGAGYDGYSSSYGPLNLSYSDGSTSDVTGGQGCINADPQFTSISDYHISQGSPCWNTGNPSLSDPDGSISDMGYYGGPDCPIYPVVYQIQITPNGSNINLEAKGRANY